MISTKKVFSAVFCYYFKRKISSSSDKLLFAAPSTLFFLVFFCFSDLGTVVFHLNLTFLIPPVCLYVKEADW